MAPTPLDDFEDEDDYDDNNNNNTLSRLTLTQKQPQKQPQKQIKKLVPPKTALPIIQKPKEEISYDDILKSMNLCVKNGQLYRIQDAVVMNRIPVLENTTNTDNTTNTNTNIRNKNISRLILKQKLYKRHIWLQKLQQEAQQKRINNSNTIKSKKFSFINENKLEAVDGPQIDLNATFKMWK